jgi:hypothetical protein
MSSKPHTFHIPVMGLAFTIDTPIKVAPMGINSVVSIMDDELIEQMRVIHYPTDGRTYFPIPVTEDDFRAKRITDYLNLLHSIVTTRVNSLLDSSMTSGSALTKYYSLLPSTHPLVKKYGDFQSLTEQEQTSLEAELKKSHYTGTIDVNIMAKADKPAYTENGEEMPEIFSNALSALRGYATSKLQSALVISAGYNPRLFQYIPEFPDFFPDESGCIQKEIVLKVSDFRSARIQGMQLAKKGIWVSEFRIESGLNCGGHAFPTEGLLMGPILEEFKQHRKQLEEELKTTCVNAWNNLQLTTDNFPFSIRYTAQGGLGTAAEDVFLREYYNLDTTGWGSPFLLVPEATNVDKDTMEKLCNATAEDYYLSDKSPLGVPFNNFRHTSSEENLNRRIEENRPGSPCYKKFLSSNKEFTTVPICVSSREYQFKKLKELQSTNLSSAEYEQQAALITEKECLCEGLSASVFMKNEVPVPHNLHHVSICPGPNLYFFDKVSSLQDMVDHIYGRKQLIDKPRPHLFINELKLYVDYLEKKCASLVILPKEQKYLDNFRDNLLSGIDYYLTISRNINFNTEEERLRFTQEMENYKHELSAVEVH